MYMYTWIYELLYSVKTSKVKVYYLETWTIADLGIVMISIHEASNWFIESQQTNGYNDFLLLCQILTSMDHWQSTQEQ